jgi:myosin-5
MESLMRLVVGVLFAGYIQFTPSRDGESCQLDATEDVKACAKLLGVHGRMPCFCFDFTHNLCWGEIVQKPLSLESASKVAEALIKAAYRAAFDFIVQYVNESMINESASGTASIGLLDIFGFETFEVNRLNSFVLIT